MCICVFRGVWEKYYVAHFPCLPSEVYSLFTPHLPLTVLEVENIELNGGCEAGSFYSEEINRTQCMSEVSRVG